MARVAIREGFLTLRTGPSLCMYPQHPSVKQDAAQEFVLFQSVHIIRRHADAVIAYMLTHNLMRYRLTDDHRARVYYIRDA